LCGSSGPAFVPVQVVERVVEVEPDKAAIVEQLRQQMKEEMAQHLQQLEGQALEAARQEAEARARHQLEVYQDITAADLDAAMLAQQLQLLISTGSRCLWWCKAMPECTCRCMQLPTVCFCCCAPQALMAASNASNEQRLALREDLKRQLVDMRAMQDAAERAKTDQQELLARIAAMESKVGAQLQ
jgi:hypothetical protein